MKPPVTADQLRKVITALYCHIQDQCSGPKIGRGHKTIEGALRNYLSGMGGCGPATVGKLKSLTLQQIFEMGVEFDRIRAAKERSDAIREHDHNTEIQERFNRDKLALTEKWSKP